MKLFAIFALIQLTLHPSMRIDRGGLLVGTSRIVRSAQGNTSLTLHVLNLRADSLTRNIAAGIPEAELDVLKSKVEVPLTPLGNAKIDRGHRFVLNHIISSDFPVFSIASMKYDLDRFFVFDDPGEYDATAKVTFNGRAGPVSLIFQGNNFIIPVSKK
jgi:hypothetical protein